MTMLDRMRRHKSWLKWSLAIVVVAFILLYIPNFLRGGGMGAAGAGSRDVVASVDGRQITVGQFRKVYNQQIQAYRRSYGGSIDERLLKQMGIDRRILQQLIDEEAGLAEARRLGIATSDEEVRVRILALPAFQENGQFIGDERYRQLLQMADPPRRPSEFEEEVRRSMTLSKLQGALTDWMTVSAADVTAEYKKRNDKVKLAVVSFPSDKFLAETTATDAEIAQQFEQHKADYRIPDKRKVRYALLDTQGIRNRTQVTAQDVQRYYEDNEAQYSTPEETRASHILLKTEGKDDAAVKKQAEDLLAKAKGGADFAALATTFSEDDSSKVKGGDLGFFPKGQMVPEFDAAAFSLPPGQISDLVKSQFGYHIIKVVERKPATKRSLDQVRAQIEDQLKTQRAQDEAQRTVTELAGKVAKPADLDGVAKPRGFTVAETDFFSRTDPVVGLGMSPAVAAQAFELKDNAVSDAVQTPQGYAFLTVTGKQAARDPSLDEVKDKVRLDVVKKKAVETARQKAASIAAQLKTGDFTAAAKAAGLEVKTTDLIARGAPIADAGVSPTIEAAAFALPAGGVSDPIVTDAGAVVVKVLEHPAISEAEMAKGLDAVRTDLLAERRNQFFSAYMAKARERMQINVNQQTVAQILA
jgi:peptidyl-prolyl cis-trans isomerase D